MDNNKLLETVSNMNYLSDIPFIFDRDIYEYDIRQANIHALLAIGKIDINKYNYYKKVPKQIREVDIGYMIQSDPSLYNQIQEVIKEAKRQFVSKNNINLQQILRIANDSIYIISPYKTLDTTVNINGVAIEFVCKNHFNSYMKLCDSILFFLDSSGDYWNLDIKGINKNKIEYHQELLSMICNIVDARINGGKESAIYQLVALQKEYVNFSLPESCYRELNAESGFRINNTIDHQSYILSYIYGLDNMRNIDISYNLNILRNIYSYLMQS